MTKKMEITIATIGRLTKNLPCVSTFGDEVNRFYPYSGSGNLLIVMNS